MSDRNRRKSMVGIVTSNKMDKSIVVMVEPSFPEGLPDARSCPPTFQGEEERD